MAVLFFNQDTAQKLQEKGTVPVGSYLMPEPPKPQAQTLDQRVAGLPTAPINYSANQMNPAITAPSMSPINSTQPMGQYNAIQPMQSNLSSIPSQSNNMDWDSLTFEKKLALQNILRSSTGARVNIAQPKGMYA